MVDHVTALRNSGVLEGQISDAEADVINELSDEEVQTLTKIVLKVKTAGYGGSRVCFI